MSKRQLRIVFIIVISIFSILLIYSAIWLGINYPVNQIITVGDGNIKRGTKQEHKTRILSLNKHVTSWLYYDAPPAGESSGQTEFNDTVSSKYDSWQNYWRQTRHNKTIINYVDATSYIIEPLMQDHKYNLNFHALFGQYDVEHDRQFKSNNHYFDQLLKFKVKNSVSSSIKSKLFNIIKRDNTYKQQGQVVTLAKITHEPLTPMTFDGSFWLNRYKCVANTTTQMYLYNAKRSQSYYRKYDATNLHYNYRHAPATYYSSWQRGNIKQNKHYQQLFTNFKKPQFALRDNLVIQQAKNDPDIYLVGLDSKSSYALVNLKTKTLLGFTNTYLTQTHHAALSIWTNPKYVTYFAPNPFAYLKSIL